VFNKLLFAEFMDISLFMAFRGGGQRHIASSPGAGTLPTLLCLCQEASLLVLALIISFVTVFNTFSIGNLH
jgi:hypothetical protein